MATRRTLGFVTSDGSYAVVTGTVRRLFQKRSIRYYSFNQPKRFIPFPEHDVLSHGGCRTC